MPLKCIILRITVIKKDFTTKSHQNYNLTHFFYGRRRGEQGKI